MKKEKVVRNIEPIYDKKEHIGNKIYYGDDSTEDSMFILGENGEFLGAMVDGELVLNKYGC